jgi:beta-glucanase (GH16 family)
MQILRVVGITGALLIAGQMAFAQERAAAQDAGRDRDADSGWKLVWADEFHKDGRPDPRNWTYETGFVRNEELQWYQPENAVCRKGTLVIEGRREQKPNPDFDPDSREWKRNRPYADYTSACLTTRGLHSWLYGRFEMRARIDTRPGLWPAFWTLGVEGDWPHNGEIDIMEYYRDTLLANVAWGAEKKWKAVWNTVRKPLAAFGDPDWPKRFHIWRMDWDEAFIRLYVDGALLNETDLRQTKNRDSEGKNPFHQPHYLLLNLAIGGTSGGDPSATEFPARFEVDYVRVYQRAR